MKRLLLTLATVPLLTVLGCPSPSDEGPTGEGEGEGEGENPGEGEGEGENPGEGEGEGENPGEGEGEGEEPAESEVVTCGPPTSGGSDVCTVTAGTGGTIVFGTVLAPGTIYEGGSVTYDDAGVLTCVGCDCDDSAAGFTQISCGDAVVSPALINAHDHAGWMNEEPWYLEANNDDIADSLRWEQRHDWRTAKRSHPKISTQGNANADAKALGEFRFALGGATATLASGGFSLATGGVIRNLDASADAEALGARSVRYVTFPLGDSNGTQLATGCGYPEIANKPTGPNAPHISEGIDDVANNEFQCLSSTANGGKDTIDENSAIIHAVGLTPFDIAVIAERGASVVWSPRSNISLYGETAPVTLMKKMGVNITLGTDWVPSGSINMQRELACATQLNDDNYGGFFSREDLWKMATINAARALHVEGALGSLAVGKRADIAIFERHGGAHASVVDGLVEDVALVLKDGKPLNGNTSVVNALTTGCDTLDVCGTSKSLCATRETGKSLATLQSGANGATDGSFYQLFSCSGDDPVEEPTCTPSRTDSVDAIAGSTLYTGLASTGDRDGDGIADASDNCPEIFNPIRPVDDGAQADADDDGAGDVCDPCPLDANSTTCSVFDPTDRDGDGIPADQDNCPNDANTDQADADNDGKGDVCDDCPNEANPGTAGCPYDIVDLKTDLTLSTPARAVTVSDLVVTAVASNGFFSQLDPASAGYPGVNNTCIFSFVGATAAKPLVGDKVTVVGSAQTFFDQIQISSATFTKTGEATITPTVIDGSAAITTTTSAGARAPLEGCLVDVRNAPVTNGTPAPGQADSGNPLNEFEVGGSLRVDDALFLITPQPSTGETLPSVKGVLSWRNSLLKLLPRSEADVALGPVVLSAIEPDTFVRVGGTGGIPEPLVVRLSRAAETDTVVTLSSSAPQFATVPASVTVVAGEATAEVAVVGVAEGASLISATSGGVTVTGDVTVLAANAPVQVVAAEPTSVSLLLGQNVDVDLILDFPAPAGTSITLAATGNVATIPASVAVAPDTIRASFNVVAAAVGTTTIVAKVGAAGEEIEIDVVVAEAPSEVNLTGFQLVRASNGNAFTLPATAVVPMGGYLVIARNTTKTAFEAHWGAPLPANAVFVSTGSDSVIVVNATSGGYSLRRNATTTIDGPTIAAVQPNSIQRNVPVAAADQASSWTVVGAADDATPGFGQEAGVAPSGCYISEVSDAIGTGAFVNEFVEIHCTAALPN